MTPDPPLAGMSHAELFWWVLVLVVACAALVVTLLLGGWLWLSRPERGIHPLINEDEADEARAAQEREIARLDQLYNLPDDPMRGKP